MHLILELSADLEISHHGDRTVSGSGVVVSCRSFRNFDVLDHLLTSALDSVGSICEDTNSPTIPLVKAILHLMKSLSG